MKRTYKQGFLTGLVVAFLIVGLSGTVMATVGQRVLTVDYTDIKIELDGQLITPTDANGAPVEPFAVNGTTYLPVRAVSNALGLGVKWDAGRKTVVLSSAEGASSQGGSFLCYPSFTVPALESVVGSDAYADLELLEDGVVYYYDIDLTAEQSAFQNYASLLEEYGFQHAGTLDGGVLCYRNTLSGIIVALTPGSDTEYAAVLVARDDDLGSEDTGSDTSADSYAFPLHLYSYDGQTYLGKLVTDPYDDTGVFGRYGGYGERHYKPSIWNREGPYGSPLSNTSAFNPSALEPPVILDNDGYVFGHLTSNPNIEDGYTVDALKQYLSSVGQ